MEMLGKLSARYQSKYQIHLANCIESMMRFINDVYAKLWMHHKRASRNEGKMD